MTARPDGCTCPELAGTHMPGCPATPMLRLGDRDPAVQLTDDQQLAAGMELTLRTNRWRMAQAMDVDPDQLRFRWRLSQDMLVRLVAWYSPGWAQPTDPAARLVGQQTLFMVPVAVDPGLPPGSYSLDLVLAAHVPS